MDNPSTYLLGGRLVTSNDPYLQQILAAAYDSPNRPRCMCTSGGVEMYIAKYGQFFIKRMPGTGSDHCASCDSYEPSASESGLGYMLGEAVVEKGPELVEVRSDFPLDRFDGRTIERADPAEKSSVTSKHKKLTIRGLQHLIWERAGFNRWTPNMKDKRGWGVIRKYSMEAAEGIELKGMRLSERLYVAEPFRSEDSEQIKVRREKAFGLMAPNANSVKHKLMFVIGEIKELVQITVGYKLVIKHMPECPFLLDARLGTELLRSFATEFQARDMQRGVRLVAAFTILMKSLSDYRVDTMTVMMTTGNWIPVENDYEKAAADALTQAERRFIKPLRYDSPRSVAFPNFLLLDAGERPVLMDILVATADKRERAAKEELIAKREPGSWVWRTDASLAMPSFPPVASTNFSSHYRHG